MASTVLTEAQRNSPIIINVEQLKKIGLIANFARLTQSLLGLQIGPAKEWTAFEDQFIKSGKSANKAKDLYANQMGTIDIISPDEVKKSRYDLQVTDEDELGKYVVHIWEYSLKPADGVNGVIQTVVTSAEFDRNNVLQNVIQDKSKEQDANYRSGDDMDKFVNMSNLSNQERQSNIFTLVGITGLLQYFNNSIDSISTALASESEKEPIAEPRDAKLDHFGNDIRGAVSALSDEELDWLIKLTSTSFDELNRLEERIDIDLSNSYRMEKTYYFNQKGLTSKTIENSMANTRLTFKRDKCTLDMYNLTRYGNDAIDRGQGSVMRKWTSVTFDRLENKIIDIKIRLIDLSNKEYELLQDNIIITDNMFKEVETQGRPIMFVSALNQVRSVLAGINGTFSKKKRS